MSWGMQVYGGCFIVMCYAWGYLLDGMAIDTGKVSQRCVHDKAVLLVYPNCLPEITMFHAPSYNDVVYAPTSVTCNHPPIINIR